MPVQMNVLVAPIPMVGELAGAEQALPLAQAQAAREAAFESLVHDRQKTPSVEAQDGMESLSKDGGGQGQPAPHRVRAVRQFEVTAAQPQQVGHQGPSRRGDDRRAPGRNHGLRRVERGTRKTAAGQ